jgi:putative protease
MAMRTEPIFTPTGNALLDPMAPVPPEILAPAGGVDSFLAALAAGADAIYCGLKHFSARMEAENFSLSQLASLTALAHSQGRRVYVAMNTLIKPDELAQVGRLVDRLTHTVHPDALIFQDLAIIDLARQAGFAGELHLSTLAAASPAAGMTVAERLGVQRVVLPRELSVDEIKAIARKTPAGLGLEVFVHGALCYAVSGRCAWSSLLGGKSGLRGRCVQPCRRRYRRKGEVLPLFSCDDLGLGTLARLLLLNIPQVCSWKIEGRKKGPHYVFHTVRAYQIFRDHSQDPKARKEAEALLHHALGRPWGRFRFLGHKPISPLVERTHTASGLLVGTVAGGARPHVILREPLEPGDLLRIGYEDAQGGGTVAVRRVIPKGGRLDLPRPAQGQPVFLVDRRPPELRRILDELRRHMPPAPPTPPSSFAPKLPPSGRRPKAPIVLEVWRRLPSKLSRGGAHGLWFFPGMERRLSRSLLPRLWWWLPPVIWPDEEAAFAEHLADVERLGGRRFVLGAPWQRPLLSPRAEAWAGPWCHVANPLTVNALAGLGFGGAFACLELGRENLLSLPASSSLPMGIVVAGMLPACLARTRAPKLRDGEPITSPKGEVFWSQQYGELFWIYPNWTLDLTPHQADIHRAGYTVLARIHEPIPQTIALKDRPGLWNWNQGML